MTETVFDPNKPVCVECGKPFASSKRKQGGGVTQIFCSAKCRSNSWARGNSQKRVLSIKQYEAKPESKEKKSARARRSTLAKYGLTEAAFLEQLGRQHFQCLGCGDPIDKTSARIDHDHGGKDATFRGLLCDSCNWTLGHVKDNRETLYRLATYLRHDRTQYQVYIIGSLRNPKVMDVAEAVRATGCVAFDDWISAGPEADDHFQKYHTRRGATFAEALTSTTAEHIFLFDKAHLDMADAGILVMPAGKSGFLELGYLSGRGKRTFILQDKDPERFDIMPQFANAGIFNDLPTLLEAMKREIPDYLTPTPVSAAGVAAAPVLPLAQVPPIMLV